MLRYLALICILCGALFAQLPVSTQDLLANEQIKNTYDTKLNANFHVLRDGLNSHTHTAAQVGAISSTILTSKGDLLVYNGVNHVRLVACADGSVYRADSVSVTGWTCAVWPTGGGGGGTYTAGPTGLVTVDNTALTIDLTSEVVRKTQANVFTGNNDMTGASWEPPHKTVATLGSAAANDKKLYVVTDGNSATDCSTGTGSTRVWCYSNGTSWVSLNTGGGGGGATSYTQVLPLMDFSGTDTGSALARANGVSYGTVNPNAPLFDGTDLTKGAQIGIRTPASWSGGAPTLKLQFTHSNYVAESVNFSVDVRCDNGAVSGTPTTFTINDTTLTTSFERINIDRTTPVPVCMSTAKIVWFVIKATSTTSTGRNHFLEAAQIVWPLS